VLLSDNQRFREQIIILTSLQRHDSVEQAKKDNIQWNRLSFLQACGGMIALYKQRKDNIQWNKVSFLQACEGMIALYKQRKDNVQGLLYSIYY